MTVRTPVSTAQSHALTMVPNSFPCSAGWGNTWKCTAPTHAQSQGAAVEGTVVPLLDFPPPVAGLVGRNLCLHPCCFRPQSWYHPIFPSNLTHWTQLEDARWKAQVHALFCMRESDDGQWDRAAPLQPPELGWSGLALQDRCPPTEGQNMAACFNNIFLHGLRLLSTEQWCWLSVNYPLWSLRISLRGIISLVCDSSFYLQTITIPEQKSPAWIAGNSIVSAEHYQGERCCPQASRTGAPLLWSGWCSSSTSFTADPLPFQPRGDRVLLLISSLPATHPRLYNTQK